ncbi:MAG: response regulator [Flavobacterium sp.]|nr:MAG: response regulator [Flavobacterium sp.]
MKIKVVLVIERDTDISTIISYALIEDGFECINYSDEFDAETIVKIDPALLIISHDISSTGIDFCKKMKKNKITRHIPLILTSTDMRLKDLAAECQANEFLHKPFDIDLLSSIVRQTIQTFERNKVIP